MNTATLYTCTGHLQVKQTQKNERYPVVILNRREYLLTPMELVLWSRLCWRFRDQKHLWSEYEAAAKEAGLPAREREEEAFRRALKHLMSRGLIAAGEGECQVDALYDLVSNLYISPISDSFWNRLLLTSKLMANGRATPAIVKSILKKDCTTEQEGRILALSRQTLLSTAELVKCEECGVLDVSSGEKVLSSLYYDDTTTCYNIAHLMRESPVRDTVVLAVSNLYLRKQIVFQRGSL